jgi:hypothetical protein
LPSGVDCGWEIALAGMTDAECIEALLLNSGLAGQSLDAVRPDLPRWLGYLHRRGVTHIPTAPWRAGPADTLAVNLLCQLALQASPRTDDMATSMAHNLRNLTNTRPYKA